MSGRDAVLVSWVSVNHGAEPLVDALSDPKSVLWGKVGNIFLCYRQAPKGDGDTAREHSALRATVRGLKEHLSPACPSITRYRWESSAAPTDHAAIRPFAEKVLRDARKAHPTSAIYIHVSPGTPAMHAVWLVLASTGLIEEPVHLIQGVSKKHREPDDPAVRPVSFSLDTWLRRYRQQRPARSVEHDDGTLWDPTTTKSPALRKAVAKLGRWAALRVPVLMLGERGTGKTTLANLLRSRSPYQRLSGDTWPTVVCGQFRVNPQLARSDLFGHKKGAFTGATHDRKGLLEQADGDTIFFDEIGDIDRDTQRLLMAALEGRGFTRLGDSKVVHSRFRVVSATNRPMSELQGELLDPDFFDRIGVFILQVPPLRECREDLPEIWMSVLNRAVAAAGVEPHGWHEFGEHPGLLESLGSHHLPGNLRDLQRVAFHALANLEAGDSIASSAEGALEVLNLSALSAVELRVPSAASLPLESDLGAELWKLESQWLMAAMTAAKGNKSKAAKLLGMNRRTFVDRQKKLKAGENAITDGGVSPKG